MSARKRQNCCPLAHCGRGRTVCSSVAGKNPAEALFSRAGAAVMAALLLMLPGCCGGGYPLRDFSTACREYQQAVGVLTATLVDGDGKPFRYEDGEIQIEPVVSLATVFAVSADEFVTNAHVLCALREMNASAGASIAGDVLEAEIAKAAAAAELEPEEYSEKNSGKMESRRKELTEKYKNIHLGAVEIRMSHGSKRPLQLRAFRLHPGYREEVKGNRELMANGERDCALLYADGAAECFFPVADHAALLSLGVGTAIGSLGFPMEGLTENGGLNLDAPEATFKEGTIGKITRPDHTFGAPEENRTICHSIPQVSGSSGSPVFLLDGRVVAILWGASTIEQSEGEGEAGEIVLSISNPAQQNFALRIDALEETRTAEKKSLREWLR